MLSRATTEIGVMRNFMLHLTFFLPAKSREYAKKFREFIPCETHLSRIDSFEPKFGSRLTANLREFPRIHGGKLFRK